MASPKEEKCDIEVSARFVSVNSGIILGVCIVTTALVIGALLADRLALTQTILFTILAVTAWIYYLDGTTEHLALAGKSIVKTSLISPKQTIPLDAVQSMVLKHEGPNQEIGIESIVIRYANGRRERLALGPCWRKHELESFLASVQKIMGYEEGMLESIR
jgi:hypothetical protein